MAVVTAVLVFGSIALLYLATEELLVGVRDVPETPWHTLMLFIGFILVFVTEMLVHRARLRPQPRSRWERPGIVSRGRYRGEPGPGLRFR